MYYYKKNNWVACEVAQMLKVLNILPENQSSMSRAHIMFKNIPNSSCRRSDALFRSYSIMPSCGSTLTDIHTKHSQIHKNHNLKKKNKSPPIKKSWHKGFTVEKENHMTKRYVIIWQIFEIYISTKNKSFQSVHILKLNH